MGHKVFAAVVGATVREPVTFSIGLLGEEKFTISPDPSLGDTFDLWLTPEDVATDDAQAGILIAKFIRRMLIPADRDRFDQALYRLPASQLPTLVDVATWIVEQMSGFGDGPSDSSAHGSSSIGRPSNANGSRSARSNKPRRG